MGKDVVPTPPRHSSTQGTYCTWSAGLRGAQEQDTAMNTARATELAESMSEHMCVCTDHSKLQAGAVAGA